jgi:N-acetyl-gamma-glutamyl-phosphate reductase
MTAKVFIDGEQGTTGLQIHARLSARKDVALLSLPHADRRNVDARRQMLNSADIVILCLPDEAAVEAVSMIENSDVRVIDASTAYRVAEDWVFGMPEYDADQRSRIADASRVSNPGCYAVASISLLHPLVSAGLLPADWPVTINAVSGYSGGGKSMIAEFEDPASASHTEAPFFVYGLTLKHKHVPEIQKHGSLTRRPLFVPSVGRFAQGMIVQIPLQLWAVPGAPTAKAIHQALADHYAGCRFVTVAAPDTAKGISRLEPELVNGTNELRLHVFANEADGQAVLVALLDNLGKGASGSTVQNMNIMLGIDEGTGLDP